jgi:hypothetical protein
MERKDRVTDWSITIFFIAVVAYAELLRESVPTIWRVGLLVGLLCFIVRLFFNSCLAYAYLKKWRFLLDNIERHWSEQFPTLDTIREYVKRYHYSVKTTETRLYFVKSQLTAGFFLLFLFPSILLIYELSFYEQNISVSIPLIWLLIYLFSECYKFASGKHFEKASENLQQNNSKSSGRLVSKAIIALFIASSFVFIITNLIAILSNQRLLPSSYTNISNIMEWVGVSLSILALITTTFYARKRKDQLFEIFGELSAAKRLDMKISYAVLVTINTLGGIIFPRLLLFAWVSISLAFFYILFSIDEYIRLQTKDRD